MFFFFLVMLEMRGEIVLGMVGWGGNNDVWTNQYPPYLKDGRTDEEG